MTLYDVLTASETIRSVSLLWVRETYVKERVRLGGRVVELIYKGSVLDISRSFVGPLQWAIEFSIFQNCWDGMRSTLTERDGVLTGFHKIALSPEDGPEEAADLRDFKPHGLFDLELVRADSRGVTIWGV